MATTKKDLSTADAEKAADAALDKATTTSVTIDRQTDGKWTVTVADSSDGAGGAKGP